MKILAFQATPSIQEEGLPFWIFWLMLLIIVLLLLFIFLRDKRLRLRLSAFFARARRRSVLFQLRFLLKRERQKKGNIIKLIGERAWDADVRVVGTENIRASLGALVKRRDADLMEAKNALSELERLHKRQEETRAQFTDRLDALNAEKQPFDDRLKRIKEELKDLGKLRRNVEGQPQVSVLEKEVGEIAGKITKLEHSIKELRGEAKDRHHDIAREIHYWEKKRKRARERIKEMEVHQDELYISFGRILEKNKVSDLALQGLYAEMDQVNHRISTLQHRIHTLGG